MLLRHYGLLLWLLLRHYRLLLRLLHRLWMLHLRLLLLKKALCSTNQSH
jgi:hypothetical protein